MNNKWVIISAPRSGSTHLERSINLALPGPACALELGELYHFYQGTIFNSFGVAESSIDHRLNSQNRLEYINYIHNLIKEQPWQSATVKIFFQSETLRFINYDQILKFYSNQNFKFIHLHRDFLSRFLSFCVARQTDYWHSIGKPKSLVQNIELDMELAQSIYTELEYVVKVEQKYVKKLDCISINYDSMESDCLINNVPFKKSPYHDKTYDDSYENIIKNYEEVVDFVTKQEKNK